MELFGGLLSLALQCWHDSFVNTVCLPHAYVPVTFVEFRIDNVLEVLLVGGFNVYKTSTTKNHFFYVYISSLRVR